MLTTALLDNSFDVISYVATSLFFTSAFYMLLLHVVTAGQFYCEPAIATVVEVEVILSVLCDIFLCKPFIIFV